MVVPILKIAILGSGPSAFYAASRILSVLPKTDELQKAVRIHMFDRLWAPHGLVRYGVAPDHPEVKNCMHKFHEIASDPRVSFFGNVEVLPPPISFPESLTWPHLQTRRPDDDGQANKPMGLRDYLYGFKRAGKAPFRILPHRLSPLRFNGELSAGEGRYLLHPNPGHATMIRLNGIFQCYTHLLIASGAPVPILHPALAPVDCKIVPALDVVYWYTGHPNSTIELMHYAMPDSLPEHITVIGNGNVALDCARILLSDPARLKPYGLPSNVLKVLESSKVKHVSIIGRRGPREASFAPKELREMMNLESVAFTGVDPDILAHAESGNKLERREQRVMDIFRKGTALKVGDAGVKRTWSLDFWQTATGVTAADGSALERDSAGPMCLTLARTRPGTGTNKVETTDETTVHETGLVITALGQRCTPETTPFCDPALGHVRTVGGSFTHPEATAPLPTGQAAAAATAVQTPESAPAAGQTATTSPLADPDVASADAAAPPLQTTNRRPAVYGQVIHPITGEPLSNIFATGWAGRGAKGVLASTMLDAHAVGEAIVDDWLRYMREQEDWKSVEQAPAGSASGTEDVKQRNEPVPDVDEPEGFGADEPAAAKRDAAEEKRIHPTVLYEVKGVDAPPTLAEIYHVKGDKRRLPLGPRTVLNRIITGMHAQEFRSTHPVMTYPEFVELQEREASWSEVAGEPVRLGWEDVVKYLRRSDGTLKWFSHLKGERPYQWRASELVPKEVQTDAPAVEQAQAEDSRPENAEATPEPEKTT